MDDREKDLYRMFIDKCVQDDDTSMMYMLSELLISVDGDINDTEKKANLYQIEILIKVLEEYKDNDELQKIRNKLTNNNHKVKFKY